MADVLEVFFMKIAGKDLLYRRYSLDWRDKSIDPDSIVDRSCANIFNQSPRELRERCIRHSSSWRWEDGVDIKTYFVYSEAFDFTRKNASWIATNDLRLLGRATELPQETACTAEDVLIHAAMHLAFLVRERDYAGAYAQKLASRALAKLKAMHALPAGRLGGLPPS